MRYKAPFVFIDELYRRVFIDYLERLRGSFGAELIFFCKNHVSAVYHQKEKCLTSERGLVQDCYKLEHHPAPNIVDIMCVAKPQIITPYPRTILQGNCPSFSVEAVVWQKQFYQQYQLNSRHFFKKNKKHILVYLINCLIRLSACV